MYISELIGRTINGFFRNPEVQREVCKISKRCSEGGGGSNTPNIAIAATDADGNIIDGSANIAALTLDDFTVGADEPVSNTDTINEAFGKIQSQIDALELSGSGTVSSVSLTVPSVFSVSGSPVTTTGTLAVTFSTGQTQNQVLASPNGSSGAVSLRALVAADIPNLSASKITSGAISTANGGTGLTAIGTGLQLIRVNSGATGLEYFTPTYTSSTRSISTTSPLSGGGDLSADRTLSIANSAADGATKGAATFTAADFNDNGSGLISIDYTNGQSASASTKGFLTSTDWSTFNNKLTSVNSLTGPALTVAVGTTGTDVAVANAGSTITINIPSASGTARGVVTTAAQTFTGVKTFTSDLNVPGIAMSGKLGVGSGTVVPTTTNLYSVSTTLPQFKGAYDTSNFITLTTASTGSTTFALSGTNPIFTFSSPVSITSGIAMPVSAAKTANYTITSADHTVKVDSTSGDITITLPTSGISTGQIYHVKKIVAANSVILDPSGAATIDGASTITMTAQWESKQVQFDGTNYIII